MTSKTYQFEILTPMFLGGENKQAELRVPSLKGVLRYFWRALHGNLTIKDLYEKETEIFGGGGKNARKSQVRIKIQRNDLKSSSNDLPSHPVPVKNFPINILKYLCYGTYKNNILHRSYFPEDKTFEVQFTYPDKFQKEIELALKVLSLLGGLGSRSRNGFGAFQIQELFPQDIKEFFQELKNQSTDKLPEFPAFSQETKLWITKQGFSNWDKALAELGKIYREARLMLENKHQYEKRKYLASPLMVKKENHSRFERYAKPYYLSLH
ncbi:MAG: type III-B CRISPR module RAMP protein Cmr1, partial [Leptospiraceae bacterium]|nr:type III-B CRISPR module RAMP protein Cmr1 [Leptospiraceae bacterium]